MADVDEEALTLEELTDAALAADLDAPLDADAEPISHGDAYPELLPSWYMPVPGGSHGASSRGRRIAAGVIIASFALINALGLCITYGVLTAA